MATVPTLLMRTGDFSELLAANNGILTGARIIRDPRTGLPFPGNVIPADRLSPNGRALLNAFPAPTPGFRQGALNWIGTVPVFNDQRKDSIKVDWVVSNDHRLAVRHSWLPNVWNEPQAMALYSNVWQYPGRTMAASFTSTLSNSLVNEIHVFLWGHRARTIHRTANLRDLPGRSRRHSVSAAESGGPHLRAAVSRDEAGSGEAAQRQR